METNNSNLQFQKIFHVLDEVIEGWNCEESLFSIHNLVGECGAFCFDAVDEDGFNLARVLLRVEKSGAEFELVAMYGHELDPPPEEAEIFWASLAKFLCYLNGRSRGGHFCLSPDCRDVEYRNVVDCSGGVIPSKEIVKNTLKRALQSMDQWNMGLIDVCYSGAKAEAVIEQYEDCEFDAKYANSLAELYPLISES